MTDDNLNYKYKMFFPKENHNDIIQDILNDKMSKIYINGNYNEIILYYFLFFSCIFLN